MILLRFQPDSSICKNLFKTIPPSCFRPPILTLLISPKDDETTLLLINEEKVNVSVPKTLKNNEIIIGLKLILEHVLIEVDTITEFSTRAMEITLTPLRNSRPSIRNSKFSIVKIFIW